MRIRGDSKLIYFLITCYKCALKTKHRPVDDNSYRQITKIPVLLKGGSGLCREGGGL